MKEKKEMIKRSFVSAGLIENNEDRNRVEQIENEAMQVEENIDNAFILKRRGRK